MPHSNPKHSDRSVFFLSPAQVRHGVKAARRRLDEVRKELPGMAVLDSEDRKHSNGRLREGEPEVMLSILDVVDGNQRLFQAMADADGGDEPSRIETEPTRANIARRAALAEVAAELEAMLAEVNDTLLVLGASIRQVVSPAYKIARAAADVNPKVRRQLGTATTFYSAPARDGARSSKKTAKTEKTA